MSLGAKLRKLRLKAGKTLQQIADKVEVSKAHIYQLEIGKAKNPSIEVIKKLAKLFSVPVTYFLEEDDRVEFQVMICGLQEDIKSLSDSDRETIELIVQALKNKIIQ